MHGHVVDRGSIHITGEMASAIAKGAPGGAVAMMVAIDNGNIRIKAGTKREVQRFFSYFDLPVDPGTMNLIVR